MELPEQSESPGGSHRHTGRDYRNPDERTARRHQFMVMPLAVSDRLAGRICRHPGARPVLNSWQGPGSHRAIDGLGLRVAWLVVHSSKQVSVGGAVSHGVFTL